MIQLGFIKDSLKRDYLFWNELFTKWSLWQQQDLISPSQAESLSNIFLSRFFSPGVFTAARSNERPPIECPSGRKQKNRCLDGTDGVCGGNITLLRKSLKSTLLNTICIRSKLSHEIQNSRNLIFPHLWLKFSWKMDSILRYKLAASRIIILLTFPNRSTTSMLSCQLQTHSHSDWMMFFRLY